MTQTSSIHIDSCRSDGRCPECGGPGWIINSPTRGVVSVWKLPCGCSACSNWACVAKHSSDLLTEALRLRDEWMDLSLRCLYRANHPTKPGAITACCVLQAGHEEDEPHKFIEMVEAERDAAIDAKDRGWEKIKELTETARVLGEERDAAIRQVEEQRHPCPCGKDTASIKWARCYSCRQEASEAVEVMREERDVALRECALAKQAQADERASLNAALRDVEMWKAKAIRVSGEADALERERDEAQAKLVEEREAMASISGELVQAQVKVAKERDSYRALLGECQDAVRIAASAEEDHGALDRARELDALAARIREVLG